MAAGEARLGTPVIHPAAFNSDMFGLAQPVLDRFKKDNKHPVKLNFCAGMAYAVAKFHDAPLLFKGDDFRHTDIRPALP